MELQDAQPNALRAGKATADLYKCAETRLFDGMPTRLQYPTETWLLGCSWHSTWKSVKKAIILTKHM